MVEKLCQLLNVGYCISHALAMLAWSWPCVVHGLTALGCALAVCWLCVSCALGYPLAMCWLCVGCTLAGADLVLDANCFESRNVAWYSNMSVVYQYLSVMCWYSVNIVLEQSLPS